MSVEVPSSAIEEQAAEWFSRRQDGPLDPAGEAAFQTWLQQSEAHANAYDDMQLLWADCDLLTRPALESDKVVVLPVVSARRSRFRSMLTLAAALLLAIGMALGTSWYAQPTYQLNASADQQQLRTLQLQDGSEVVLNLGAQVHVRYFRDRREVELSAGEAFFSVSPDATKPFLISVGDAEVRVVGTRFNVRRSDQGVAVAVEQGTVQVDPGTQGLAPQLLQVGEVAEVDYRRGLVRNSELPTNEIGSWRTGMLIFRDRSLGELAQELSRYLDRPVLVGDAQLAAKRVSGSLDIHQPELFLQALPLLLPVQISRTDDGRVMLQSR